MIRKNLLLCKIIRIKTSSKSLFDSYMALFRPELETCPICGSTGNCHIHDYYGRSIIDFKSGRQKNRIFVFSGYSATAVTMHMPFSRTSSSLTPATACSLSCASLGNTSQISTPLSSSVNGMESPGTSFSSGLLSSDPTSRNGLVCYQMLRFQISLF